MGESLLYLLLLVAVVAAVGTVTFLRVRMADRREDELVARIVWKVLAELPDGELARRVRAAEREASRR